MIRRREMIEFPDTPSSYSGYAGKYARVNTGETGLEFSTVSGGSAVEGATLVVAASDSKDTSRADYVCDGTNDEYEIETAIGALPAGGGCISLLEGTYSISSSIDVTKSNVCIVGNGHSTILSTTEAHVFVVGDGTNSYNNIRISNLRINSTSVYHGVHCKKNITYSTFDNLYVYDSYHGVFFDLGGCHYNTVYNCIFDDQFGAGVEIEDGCYHNTIEICNITGSLSEGIYISDGSYTKIIGCTIKSGVNYGIQTTEHSHSVKIIGNTINADVYGIQVGGYGDTSTSKRTIISGNTIYECGQHGIHVDYLDDSRISGNTIISSSQDTDATYHGINIDHANNVAVSGNTIRRGDLTNKPAYGINITANATLVMVHGNDLYDSGSTGDINDAGTNTRKRDNIANDGTWMTDV